MGHDGAVQIRPAVPDDAPDIARVQVAGWRAGYAGLLPADVLAGLDEADWACRRREYIESGGRVLVVTDPAIAGCAAYGPSRAGGAEGELYAFYLDPPRWRQGLGSALMRVVADELDALYPRSVLWVLRGNARARAFYAVHGWAPDGEVTVASGPGGAVLDEVRLVRTRSPAAPPVPGRPGPSAPPSPPAGRAR
jgi:GNAT superfamily N-acetyltransferase